jgi:hypothetical protein
MNRRLAADIAGYSPLMHEDETSTVRDLKAHQGVVLNHGKNNHVGGHCHRHPAHHSSDSSECHDTRRAEARYEQGTDEEEYDDFGGDGLRPEDA